MAKALTARSVENITPGSARMELPDGLVAGLYFVVQPSGSRSWAVRYRHEGKTRKLTLGPYPAIGISDARRLARLKLQAAAEGSDPAALKIETRRKAKDDKPDKDLMKTVAADFVERYAKKKNRSWAETERLLNKEVVSRWGKRRIQDIKKRDVIELLDEIVDRGAGTTANRTLAAVRKLFNWAVERDMIAANPCAGVKPPAAETSRERILSDDELRWFWKACDKQGYPFGPFGQVLLLTGQRRNEVAGMTASEVDIDARLWTIPRARAKNDQEHHVPLSDDVLAILAAMPRIAGEAGYLFTTSGKTPVSGYSRAKAIVTEAMVAVARQEAEEAGEDPDAVSVPPWTLHDLRRTAASGMARLGIPVHVVEAVLNHKSGAIKGVAAIYNRYNYADEKRNALDAWAHYVAGLMDGESTNVVPITNRRSKRQ